jgi:small subunit ribosomal protein S21
MIEVQLDESERLDIALKKFQRKLIKNGLFKDMRKKRFYEKPSEVRQRKASEARRRTARALRRGR